MNDYSPNYLVFGKNVNLPSMLTDKPPALKSSGQIDLIRNKLAPVMHSARLNFIKTKKNLHKVGEGQSEYLKRKEVLSS